MNGWTSVSDLPVAQGRSICDHEPLGVLFVLTSMPVGGAETLLVNLVRRLDRRRFRPRIVCLKQPGELGELIAREVPLEHSLLAHKYDLRVLPRLVRHIRAGKVRALVTVGAGDKMFWGRLAARWCRLPVVVSALHSTGWPDQVTTLNRWLTGWTDALIAVAEPHADYLIHQQGFPAGKVHVIPNGVDTQRFRPDALSRRRWRHRLPGGLEQPVVGIVAALRPEKNHVLFLEVARRIASSLPDARFLVVGDGPRRADLEVLVSRLGLERSVRFLGTQRDIPGILAALDVFLLTSDNEASPVSILEALAVAVPVVATDVGSVHQVVRPGITGYLADAGDVHGLSQHTIHLLKNPQLARSLGAAGRCHVIRRWSLDRMVRGYEELIQRIYAAKLSPLGRRHGSKV